MNFTHKLIIVAFALCLAACSSINSAAIETLNTSKKGVSIGKVSNMKQVEVRADYPERLTGAGAGIFVANAIGGAKVLNFITVIAGVHLADRFFGQNYDLLEVMSKGGELYEALVPVGYFKLNDSVNFTAENDVIVSISKSKT